MILLPERSVDRLLCLLGDLVTSAALAAGPRLAEEMVLSEPSEVLDCVRDDLRSLPFKKPLILDFLPPTSKSSSPSRAPTLLGMMAEADSKSYFFLPFTLSFSLPKGERGLSFTDRSNMLAVRLVRVNWTLTSTSPRSFSFFPALECSLCHLETRRKEKERRLRHLPALQTPAQGCCRAAELCHPPRVCNRAHTDIGHPRASQGGVTSGQALLCQLGGCCEPTFFKKRQLFGA